MQRFKYGDIVSHPGEFSGAIGPAGSKKAPIVRALWQGNLNQEAYDTNSTALSGYTVGQYVYCGGNSKGNVGLYTCKANASTAGQLIPVGICTHVPTTQEPWLGVASLL